MDSKGVRLVERVSLPQQDIPYYFIPGIIDVNKDPYEDVIRCLAKNGIYIRVQKRKIIHEYYILPEVIISRLEQFATEGMNFQQYLDKIAEWAIDKMSPVTYELQ